MSALRILFYGTPDFAVATLNKLIQEKKEVIGAVTAPDKPAGRGYELKMSEVKKFASRASNSSFSAK
jgi:methionyl-tRNA formyltransferase